MKRDTLISPSSSALFSFFPVYGEQAITCTHTCLHLISSCLVESPLQGTFTKSFGSCGGYIAGSKQLIDWLRAECPAHLYATAMSPSTVEMVLSALHVISGADGTDRGRKKIAALRDNANYFRARLLEMGLNVLGDWDSPVMPVMIFNPAKLPACSREMLKRGVAVVVVGFPATPLLTARMRVCISASHSREDLDFALEAFEEVADLCQLRYADVAENARHILAAKVHGVVA
jgi:serine palmitoyltransferase